MSHESATVAIAISEWQWRRRKTKREPIFQPTQHDKARSTERFRRWAHIILRQHQLQTIYTLFALHLWYCHSHQPLPFSQRQIYWSKRQRGIMPFICCMSEWLMELYRAHANIQRAMVRIWSKSQALSFAKWKLIVHIWIERTLRPLSITDSQNRKSNEKKRKKTNIKSDATSIELNW